MADHVCPDPEELLQHAEWMTAMAVSLVGDPSRADDVVQGAWAAAIEAPPRSSQALAGWLRTVVRNLSWQTHRQESRRRKRELLAARPEAQVDSAEDLVARTELQRLIVEAVLSLPEPYRSTVILRFFENRTPAEIAARDGIPVKTVWTRLTRAFDKLRRRLDKDHRGTEPWCSILLPLTAAPALASGSAVSTAGSTAGTAPTFLATTATGIAVIMSKVTASITIVGLVAIGLAIGHYTADSAAPALAENLIAVDRVAYSQLQTSQEELNEDLIATRVERDAERSRAEELTVEIATLRQGIVDAEAARTAATELEGARTIPVAFGQYAELEGVKNADWSEMAEAVASLTALLLEGTTLDNAGKDHPPGFTQNIRQENIKLVKYLASVSAQIATHAPVNGEYTHPVTLTNILGAMLEREDLALDDPQRRRIIAHGESYEADYDRLQDSYDDRTGRQRKLLDELSLKRRTMGQIDEELTDEQRDVVIEPYLQDRIEIDPRSPIQMLLRTVGAFVHDSPEELRAAVPEVISKLYKIPATDLVGLEPVFDDYMAAVESLLTPIPASGFVKFYPIDDAIIAGEAFWDMTEAVLAHPTISDDSKARIRRNPRWFVPRIRAAE